MNEYVIYTTEGYTQNPAGNDVNNCQVLGVGSKGNTAAEAIAALENDLAISELGFDPDYAKAVQTITKEQQDAIRLLVASTTGEEQPGGAELEEAIETLREMVSGFTSC